MLSTKNTISSRCSESTVPAVQASTSRRSALTLFVAAAPLALRLDAPAHALNAPGKMDLPNKEVDDSTSPYIQSLLKKSNELKEDRKKERLDAYYQKNFKDYLDFEAGVGAAAKRRGISDKTSSAIQQWLTENQD